MKRRADKRDVLWTLLFAALWICVSSVGFVALCVLLGYRLSM
jgi:hypothetical protein